MLGIVIRFRLFFLFFRLVGLNRLMLAFLGIFFIIFFILMRLWLLGFGFLLIPACVFVVAEIGFEVDLVLDDSGLQVNGFGRLFIKTL